MQLNIKSNINMYINHTGNPTGPGLPGGPSSPFNP